MKEGSRIRILRFLTIVMMIGYAAGCGSSAKSYATHTYIVGVWPVGIAIDASGNIWVTSSHDNTITKLSPTGETIGEYNTAGETPFGIAIDSGGNVWVANNGFPQESNTVTELVGVAKGPQYWPYKGPQWP